MIWVANFLLILCYILLGRNSMRYGWAASILGNGIYLVIMLQRHAYDLAFLPAIFSVLAAYNLWLLFKPLKSTNS